MPIRRNRPIAALTVIAGVLAPVSAHCDATQAARHAIQSQYDLQAAAAARLDPAGTLAACAPNFTEIEKSGKRITLAQERQAATRLLATARSFSGKSTIRAFSVTGNTAVVRVQEHDSATVAVPGASQIAHILYNNMREDTWQKHGHSWLLVHSKILSEAGTVNGQPLPQ